MVPPLNSTPPGRPPLHGALPRMFPFAAVRPPPLQPPDPPPGTGVACPTPQIPVEYGCLFKRGGVGSSWPSSQHFPLLERRPGLAKDREEDQRQGGTGPARRPARVRAKAASPGPRNSRSRTIGYGGGLDSLIFHLTMRRPSISPRLNGQFHGRWISNSRVMLLGTWRPLRRTRTRRGACEAQKDSALVKFGSDDLRDRVGSVRL